jgi:UDPglucose 6-dehydrogenase
VKICIIGTGYVGLVTGVCLAEFGHEVGCVDLDAAKVDKLKNGESPIFEPGLEEMIQRNLKKERLSFDTSLSRYVGLSEVYFIAVGTPEGEDGSADLSYVLQAAEQIAELATKSVLVIVKSTVPVGTCTRVEARINEILEQRNKPNIRIQVASNPEFLKEGAAIQDFMYPDRIVCGVNEEHAKEQIFDLYRPFIQNNPNLILFMDRTSSELTKYASNAMLATRISFMNELAQLADKVGANIDSIRVGMGTDPRIGSKFLYAGPGYGGSCFPKDVVALIHTGQENQTDLSILKSVELANKNHRIYITNKIIQHFGERIAGKRIAVWGLAFKPKTDDVRESPAADIIEILLKHGALISVHDPEAMQSFKKSYPGLDIVYNNDPFEALTKADALVLVTEWSDYKQADFDRIGLLMNEKIVFDFRNQYKPAQLRSKGFQYYCIGRP